LIQIYIYSTAITNLIFEFAIDILALASYQFKFIFPRHLLTLPEYLSSPSVLVEFVLLNL